MSKFRKFACVFIVLEILMLVFSNIYAVRIYNDTNTNAYKVDISRIVFKLETGESLDSIDLHDYKTIVSVRIFNPNENSRYDYTVEEVNGQLYKFEYRKFGIEKVLIILNVSLTLVIIMTIALFIYLDKKIVSPFKRMNNLTTELAKGNLAVPIKQEKSRYFKQFLWGMDMLREKLEGDRIRELDLLKEKKTLILSLSHDIKTPLAAIDLYTKALKSNLYDSEEGKLTAIEGIEKNIFEIKRYVSEIANASREDFLSLDVQNSEFYLSDILKEIAEYYKDKCEQLHIEFQVEQVNNCILFGDKDRIVEVIQNVMENAVKYGDGRLIGISFEEEENCKLITVSNTGCSIREEELYHLFDSFYRGSNSEKVNGSGLGLYICKELMHKMEGDIFAKIYDDKFCITVVLRKM